MAYRTSAGALSIWSYNCGSGRGVQEGPTNVSVPGYGASTIKLYASYDGPGRWSGWYYRFDTAQWVYVSSTSGMVDYLRPWAESTGYNYNSTRKTYHNNFKATNAYLTDGLVSIPCERHHTDGRQFMRQLATAGTAHFGPLNNWGTSC